MQCSRASVSLADRLGAPFAVSVAGDSRKRDSDVFTGCPLPPQGGACDGDNSNSNNRDENAATVGVVETSAEGRSEGVPFGLAEGRAKDDGEAVTWSRLKLELRGVLVEKVVEKDSVGRTARVAMAVSCKEVCACKRRRGGRLVLAPAVVISNHASSVEP